MSEDECLDHAQRCLAMSRQSDQTETCGFSLPVNGPSWRIGTSQSTGACLPTGLTPSTEWTGRVERHAADDNVRPKHIATVARRNQSSSSQH